MNADPTRASRTAEINVTIKLKDVIGAPNIEVARDEAIAKKLDAAYRKGRWVSYQTIEYMRLPSNAEIVYKLRVFLK